jgi:hypothetical protein
MKQSQIRWIFDPLPASQTRRGGDPAEHAFQHDIDTFVREVIQNANDQAVTQPQVIFRLRDIHGKGLAKFLNAMDWPTLSSHLGSVAHKHLGLQGFLKELDRSSCMRILVIEDRNTIGLEGDELHGESHFRALCKDTLYSHKQAELGAGGSYGLGKSVLWSFSGLSTVLFNSVLRNKPRGRLPPRLIGRAELPSHAVPENGRRWFTGSGWFGQASGTGVYDEHAESLWGPQAAERAKALYLSRDGHSGTSILILGFRDPTADEKQELGQLATAIRRAALRFFWPAMHMDGKSLQVLVGVDDDDADVANIDVYPELGAFVQCYTRRAQPSSRLDEPGDIVTKEIELEIPARRDARTKKKQRCKLELSVRIPLDEECGEDTGHVAMFRGAGMVLKYWNRRNMAIEMPAFHATLACGLARDPGNSTGADRALEDFLRAAEPPGHDQWLVTPRLSETYESGSKTALLALHARVNQALRDLLTAKPRQGQQGPERLRKLFPIGPRGGKGSAPSAFHFSELHARLVDGRWQFSGEIQPTDAGSPWQAVIELRELGDDGGTVEIIAVERVKVSTRGVVSRIHDGKVELSAPARVPSAAFSGTSVALGKGRAWQGELSLEVTGSVSSGEAP